MISHGGQYFWCIYDTLFQNARLAPEGYIKLIGVCKFESVFPNSVHSESTVKLELDLESYTTKTDLSKATGVNICTFTKVVDTANIIKEIDELSTLKTLMCNIDKMSLS